MMVDVNKQRMIDNQTYVKHIPSTVMHRPSRFTNFTLGLALTHIRAAKMLKSTPTICLY
jgi:hypothetical protein